MSAIKNKIQSLKDLRAHVSPSPEWLKTNRETLLMQVTNTLENTATREEKFSWWKFNNFWSFLNIFLPKGSVSYVLRPVLATMAIFGLVFGGWTATVFAASNSLPGDVLYSIKLVTENMQTSLASKPEEIKLRMEFAGRRAEEVKKIVESTDTKIKKEKKVEEAVKHLKNDLETVKVNLDNIKNDAVKTGTSQVVVAVAKVVDQKSTEIQKSLEQTNIDAAIASKDSLAVAVDSNLEKAVLVKDQVKQAAAIAQETGVKAVQVIVEKHNADNASVSREEVKNIVDNKLKDIEAKVTKIEAEVSTMVSSSTTVQTSQVKEEQAKLVEPVKATTEAAKTTLTAAKDELAKDNLDAAVDKLKESSVLSQAAEIKVDATKILTASVEQVISSSTVSGSVSTTPSSVSGTPAVVAPATSTNTTTIK